MTVLGWAKDNFNRPKVKQNDNHVLDSRMYIIKMIDGVEMDLQHNFIAQNIFSQCDSEGRRFLLLDEIADVHCNNDAVKKDDDNAFTISKNGNKHPTITTKGREMLCTFKDQSQDWVPLKDMKASNPLETAVFSVARGIDKEPALLW